MTNIGRQLLQRAIPVSLAGRIRKRRFERGIRHSQGRTVHHTYCGEELAVTIRDWQAEDWYDRDLPMLAELVCLRRRGLEPGARVFDLGAHQGVIALVLSRTVGPDGHVLALEANPYNAAVAEENKRANAAANLTILPCAIAEHTGTLQMSGAPSGQVLHGDMSWGRIEVPCTSVDRLVDEHGMPDVIYMDIDGFECSALAGARRTIAEGGPTWFIETHVGRGLEDLGGSVQRVVSFFPSNQYDLLMGPMTESFDELERQQDAEYVPLDLGSDMVKSRFGLVAVAPGGSGR